ncbi:hypothetical protein TWF102_001886 [Orbilia oligospora]|uniref:Uncharacterized protein n=1 Tax=Orbilia oligospora TaxID=2813651 RepID=A0A7C8JAC4_ORBOL|nr:hypothetical protein TWF103_007709 [Orbilia oligospora]KAF3105986.1 hypothetical protein TWF102_001886 [Orbilia oligospora]
MTKETTLPQPANTLAMAGDNTYNENSGQQYLAMEACLPLFESLSFGANATFVDYGCSQGAASMAVMQRLVSQLPSNSTATLVFNDLPSNDFNSLIKLLPNIKYFDSTKTIYPCIIPNSFYNPIMPQSTVDVAFALSSIHWLRQVPPPKSASESFEEFLRKRDSRNSAASHKDLIEFLNLRGREIKSGGKLIVAAPSPCADNEDGRITGNERLRCALFKAMENLIAVGKLPPNATAGIYPPNHVHTEQSFRAAINETGGVWKIEKVYSRVIPHPAYQTMLESQKGSRDTELHKAFERAYANTVVNWILAVFEPFMKSWWIEEGLNEEACEQVFKECSSLAKIEFVENAGAQLPVAQDFIFVRLNRY